MEESTSVGILLKTELLLNTRLSTKALLATIVPLSISIIWLLALWINSQNIQRLNTREHEQEQFEEQVNEFTQLYCQLQGAFVTALITQSAPQQSNFIECKDRFIEMSSVLEKSRLILPNQRAALEQLRKYAEGQDQILKEAGLGAQEDRWSRFLRYRKSISKSLNLSLDDKRDVKEFLAPQRLELQKIRRKLQEWQKLFNVLLVAGMSANVLVAVFFHLAYARFITSRVRELVEHAEALSRKDVSFAKLSGSDEFAMIDKAIHNSALEIVEAFERKRFFLDMIGHDLKSPLAASEIALSTLFMSERNILSERTKNILDNVMANNLRVISLVEDLLTLDAFETGNLRLSLEPNSVHFAIEEAFETLSASAAARKITLKNLAHEEIGNFDKRRILQVLVNLIANAIKFSNSNSDVVVTCERYRDRKLVVSVTNEGRRIDPKEQSFVFEKYYQTAEGKSARGSGLGLAISKLIVETHGGRIGVLSHSEKSCTFWFTIPFLD